KTEFCFTRFVLTAATGLLLSGCLLRPATVSPRRFVLSPLSADKPVSIADERLSVGIGPVRMPSYLLRSSMIVRNGANEIQYLEDALWGERLDHCFQRTLAANLAKLLPSDSIYLTDWRRDQVMVKVSIAVEQFEVDTRGRGS